MKDDDIDERVEKTKKKYYDKEEAYYDGKEATMSHSDWNKDLFMSGSLRLSSRSSGCSGHRESHSLR